MHAFLDHDGPIAFAHRGGTLSAPENTMAAFADAVSLGYRYLETDVQVTTDGVLVAFHDDNLLRTCGVDKFVSRCDWSEITKLRVGGREPIPRLEEVVETWPEVRVNIDCKTDAAVAPFLEYLSSSRVLDRVCVGSFSDKRLSVLRGHFGDALCSSMGPRSVIKTLLGTFGVPVGTHKVDVAQVPERQGKVPVCSERFIDYCHRHKIFVHVWTVDDPGSINRLLDMGVDGVMSDDIRALKDVFVARGVWSGGSWAS